MKSVEFQQSQRLRRRLSSHEAASPQLSSRPHFGSTLRELQEKLPSAARLQSQAQGCHKPVSEMAFGGDSETSREPSSRKLSVPVAVSRHSAVSLRLGQQVSTRPMPRLSSMLSKPPGKCWVRLVASWPPPNSSFNRTCYGGRRKAGLQYSVHCRKPALRHPPQQAG